MKYIEIPESHLDGFRSLSLFSTEDYEKFKEIVSTIKFDGQREIFESLDQYIGALNQDYKDIFKALISVFLLHADAGEIDGDFIEGFSASFNRKLNPKKKNQTKLLTDRIKDLFYSSHLLILSLKAASLYQEAEHLFSQGRVLTDIRPIFNKDASEFSENYAILLHRLKIEFNEEDGRKDIYFTMTRNQILELSETLARALEKERTIKSKTHFKFL
ncbi:hypothetical protein SAMN00777080_3062 [Aquiflexum balticum DSM 16537]|uniref:Uncharacterized protein n=1 Tax=Aquiflexum balticum DSM 16537 TaxID=758820 RepID=A0A1W2H6D2_9BACT|nr:hypothetical protein SAMN00777080_3062 [Aquiflexum balticum DSM 16537]